MSENQQYHPSSGYPGMNPGPGSVGYHGQPSQPFQATTEDNHNGDTQYQYSHQSQAVTTDGGNNMFANGDILGLNGAVSGGASNLDHALLESLFYNEMALLDASSDNTDDSVDFIAHHLAEATSERKTPPPHPLHQDPTTIVEKEILRDFGVGTPRRGPGGTPAANQPYAVPGHAPPAPWQGHQPQHATMPQHHPPSQQHQHQQSYPPQYAHVPPPTGAAPPPPGYQYPPPHYGVPAHPQAPAGASLPPHHVMIQMDIHASSAGGPTPHMHTTITSTNNPHQPKNASPAPLPPLQAEPPVASPQPSQVVVPKDRARQLVDQFATLASRLGIDLPDTVLQSLTTAAAKNDPSLVQPQEQQEEQTASTPGSSPRSPPQTTTAEGTGAGQPAKTSQDENSQNGNTKLDEVASTVAELRKTAEEAIAAVTRKRNLEHQESTGSADNDDGKSDDPSCGNATSNKPAFSKRRKKPRLAECESKLARLQAENEQLKRHLENVSNKAHKFDKEKEEAGKRIAQLLHENAGPEAMAAAVREFSDMYSDYGVNRQQELSFHLEQLQRLVNPTNFTKMGLWTLGQSNHDPKRNPIAGILVKELTITPQQGRKILDQSEKIRKLCDNLRETHALLGKLKTLCEKKTQIFHDRMTKCTEILTSQQVVKLISWINQHTDLLGTVCPGWGTEQIIASKKPPAK